VRKISSPSKYNLELALKELEDHVKKIEEQINTIKTRLGRIAELLDHVAILPEGVKFTIPHKELEELLSINKDNVLQKLDNLSNIYKMLSVEAVVTLLQAPEIVSRAHECRDVELYHEVIVSALKKVAENKWIPSGTIVNILKGLLKEGILRDPCSVYHEVLRNVEALRELDGLIAELGDTLSRFLVIDRILVENAIINYLKKDAESFADVIGKRKDIEGLRDKVNKLSRDLERYDSLTLIKDELNKCELKAPHSIILLRRISESIDESADKISTHYKALRNLLESDTMLNHIRGFIESFEKYVDEVVKDINTYLGNYMKLLNRFKKDGKRIAYKDLRIGELSVLSIRALCEDLKAVDEILASILGEISGSEKEILEKVLNLLYKAENAQTELHYIVKSLSIEELNALLKLCEKGILRCFVGV